MPPIFSKKNAFLLLLLLPLVWAFAIEPRRLTIVEYEVHDTRLAGLTLAFISDLHFTEANRDLMRRTVECVMAAKPDLILLGGDYVSRRNFPQRHLMAVLGGLSAPLGVYAILGNHDVNFREPVQQGLRQAGISTLVNASVPLNLNGRTFWLAGLDDPVRGQPDLPRTLAGTAAPTLLLSHSPDIVTSPLPEDTISLVLSGHSHGGQINLPLLGSPVSTVERDLLYGLNEKNGLRVLTSGGVGTSVLPARFLRPPEVVLLRFVEDKV